MQPTVTALRHGIHYLAFPCLTYTIQHISHPLCWHSAEERHKALLADLAAKEEELGAMQYEVQQLTERISAMDIHHNTTIGEWLLANISFIWFFCGYISWLSRGSFNHRNWFSSFHCSLSYPSNAEHQARKTISINLLHRWLAVLGGLVTYQNEKRMLNSFGHLVRFIITAVPVFIDFSNKQVPATCWQFVNVVYWYLLCRTDDFESLSFSF